MTPERFQEIREAMGLDINEMAHRCGVVPRTVYRWENEGIKDGSAIKLVQLIHSLDQYMKALKKSEVVP